MPFNARHSDEDEPDLGPAVAIAQDFVPSAGQRSDSSMITSSTRRMSLWCGVADGLTMRRNP